MSILWTKVDLAGFLALSLNQNVLELTLGFAVLNSGSILLNIPLLGIYSEDRTLASDSRVPSLSLLRALVSLSGPS